jgi:hypothetical protein
MDSQIRNWGVLSTFRDNLHTHQAREVVHAFHMVTVKHHAVQQRHGVLGFKDTAPVGSHLGRVANFGNDLGTTAMDRLGRNFDNLTRRGEYRIQVDHLGTSDGLAKAVLDLGHTATTADLGMPAEQVWRFGAIRAIHLQRCRAMGGPQSVARGIESSVALESGTVDHILKQEHGQ